MVATIQPAITLLGLGIGAALLARALRLNPIVGYLGLGLALASLGMAQDFSGPVVAAMAEAGNIFGFGSLQMLVAGGAFAALFAALGLLVPAGALASGGALGPALGIAATKALAAFGVAVLFARYLTEPQFRLIARAGTTEVYTATALFIALAAGWATGMADLSLTLGAFLGGLSINPALLVQDWSLVASAALVLLALPAVAGLVEPRLVSALVTAIAISLAVTPFVSNLGRKLAGRLRAGPPDAKLARDDAPVLIIGMTPAGRALADAYHVHHANPADPRSWDAIGMERRRVLVVATGQVEASRGLTALAQQRLPDVTRIIAVPGAAAVEEFASLGMVPIDMSMSGGHERLTDLVFTALEQERKVPVPRPAHDDEAPNDRQRALAAS